MPPPAPKVSKIIILSVFAPGRSQLSHTLKLPPSVIVEFVPPSRSGQLDLFVDLKTRVLKLDLRPVIVKLAGTNFIGWGVIEILSQRLSLANSEFGICILKKC